MAINKKKMPMWQKIFYIIAFVFLIGAFIFLGTRNYKVKELSDNELFSKEYKNVTTDNLFQVLDSEEALTLLERGTGILFFGFPENKWSSSVAELLDEVSKKKSYSVLYFNFKGERESKHDNYLGIVREIDDYLKCDDLGNVNVLAPTIVAVQKGKVFYFNDELTFVNNMVEPKDYWTNEKKEKFISEMEQVIRELKGEVIDEETEE